MAEDRDADDEVDDSEAEGELAEERGDPRFDDFSAFSARSAR
ncbi:MAG: hypothetical protein PHY05_07875 [Methanothrix sp.]|nr:hypothetical protein [Methanothrix sp.]